MRVSSRSHAAREASGWWIYCRQIWWRLNNCFFQSPDSQSLWRPRPRRPHPSALPWSLDPPSRQPGRHAGWGGGRIKWCVFSGAYGVVVRYDGAVFASVERSVIGLCVEEWCVWGDLRGNNVGIVQQYVNWGCVNEQWWRFDRIVKCCRRCQTASRWKRIYWDTELARLRKWGYTRRPASRREPEAKAVGGATRARRRDVWRPAGKIEVREVRIQLTHGWLYTTARQCGVYFTT